MSCVVCGLEAGNSFCGSICCDYRDYWKSGQGAHLFWLDADLLERAYCFRGEQEWKDTFRLGWFPFCRSID